MVWSDEPDELLPGEVRFEGGATLYITGCLPPSTEEVHRRMKRLTEVMDEFDVEGRT